MKFAQRILVVDVETTGLDPSKSACIEIGAVLLDDSLDVVREFSSLVLPWENAEIVSAAMEVNRIPTAALENAPSIINVIRQFDKVCCVDGVMPLLAGWNVWLDVSFLRDLYRRAHIDWPFRYRMLDVQSVLSFHTRFSAMSQEAAIKHFLNEPQEHRALADAKHTAKLLKLMAEKYL